MARLAYGLALAFAALLLVLGPEAASAEKRVALVIGNAAYAHAPALTNPSRDARDVAAVLTRLGFEVQLGVDLTQAETVKAMDTFAKAMAGSDAALLYYSGHGLQIDGGNYLLPVDITVESPRSVRYGAVDVGEIVREMETKAGVALVVLDACRDNPFAAQLAAAEGTRSVAATRGLARLKAAGAGTIIAYAAAAGSVASDGGEGNSPYTKAFLTEVEKPDVEVGLLFRRVAGKVVEATAGAQRPEVLISLTREFYMAATSPALVQAALPETPAGKPAVPTTPAAKDAPPPPVTTPLAPVVEKTVPPPASPPPQSRSAAPYADLLARLDLSAPPYQAPPPWQAPPTRDVAEVEPDNTPATAVPVGVNDRVKLAIDPVGDGDWLYFTAGAAGTITVKAASEPANIDLVVQLLDADRRVVAGWQGTPRPGGALDAAFDVPAPGAYWLEVRDNANDAASPQPIDLALGYTAQEDALEPDNAPSQARILPLEGHWRLNIFPVGDADFLKFPIGRPGEFTVEVTDAPPDIDLVVRLLDANQAPVSNWVTAPRPGGDVTAVFPVQKPGWYTLEVRDGANDKGSVKAFALATHFAASPDEHEPNDTLATPTVLPPGGAAGLTIFPVGDVDWIAIDAAQPGQLSLSASNVPKDLDVVFRVLNGEQRDLTGWITPPRKGGDTLGQVDLPQAGRYLVEIRDGSNDAASIEPIQFKTEFIASPDNYEPNDSMGQATPLRVGGSIAFAIMPVGDADWFRLTVDRPGELAFAIDDGPKNLDLVMHVLDADQHDLTGWIPPYSKGGRTEGLADLRAPGTYFIEIRDGANDARAIEPATLTTKFTPSVAEGEPNDTFGSATPQPLDGTTSGTILPVGDADWQVVRVSEPGMLAVTIDQVPAELDVVFRVLDGDQRDLTGWIAPPRKGGDTYGKARLEHPGWYWIEVRDGANDARSPKPFRIVRQFTAGLAAAQ